MSEPDRLRSSISTQLVTRTLFRGVLLSFLGICGLCYGGVYLNPSSLMDWGWLLYLISIGLITTGMLPYRRLIKLQLNPEELYLTENHEVIYFSKKRKLLTLPLEAVESWEYIDTWNRYGIAVKLKSSLQRPIVVHQRHEEVEKLRKRGHDNGRLDLFFPYFSKYVCEELKNWQNEEIISLSE
jgi:hypothetical protein